MSYLSTEQDVLFIDGAGCFLDNLLAGSKQVVSVFLLPAEVVSVLGSGDITLLLIEGFSPTGR